MSLCFLPARELSRLKCVHRPSVHTLLRSSLTQESCQAPATTATPALNLSEFHALKGRVSDETFNALTSSPFNLTHMTPVQSLVAGLLPHLSRSHDPSPRSNSNHTLKDLLVRARTGTGKTLAFLVPAIENRLNAIEKFAQDALRSSGLSSPNLADRARGAFRRASAGPLILSPTRELATQIADVALKLTTHHQNFHVTLFVGGASKGPQMKEWMSGRRDIVVATPGRMRDLLENEPDVRKSMKDCNLLILDEADTLLDMGFRDDIDAIANLLAPRPNRQTFLFSATLSERIRQIATAHLSPNHQFLDASPPTSNALSSPNLSASPSARVPWAARSDSELTTHPHVPQYYTTLPSVDAQVPTLLRLIAHDQLAHGSISKIILFCPTTHSTAFFATLLRELISDGTIPSPHTRIIEMHSKLTQGARQRASDAFRGVQLTKSKSRFGSKETRSVPRHPTILVTSDVSARGVDYPAVTRVIQLGVPSSEALYVHRIGRTGRGAATLGLPTESASSAAPTALVVDSANCTARQHSPNITTSEPRHRADLLLFPWEAGYLTWKLTQFPIKALTTATLESQVASLASASSCPFPRAAAIYGTHPTTERKDGVTRNLTQNGLTDIKAIPQNENGSSSISVDPLSAAVASVLPLLDKEAVRQAAASFLGHYLVLTGTLGVQPGRILEGIAAWSRHFGVQMGKPNEAWRRRMGIDLAGTGRDKPSTVDRLISSKYSKGTYNRTRPQSGRKTGRRKALAFSGQPSAKRSVRT